MKTFWTFFSLTLFSVLLVVSISIVHSHFYPMKYKDEINNFSKTYNVNPALVASVINVESGYNNQATSRKGARGLMQLMPTTAKWLCDLLQIEFDEDKLAEPSYNIQLGTYYLSVLQNKFSSQDAFICSYNAGPTQVKSWLSDSQYSSDGLSLSVVPFKETKNYLTKVEKNLNYYSKKYK